MSELRALMDDLGYTRREFDRDAYDRKLFEVLRAAVSEVERLGGELERERNERQAADSTLDSMIFQQGGIVG